MALGSDSVSLAVLQEKDANYRSDKTNKDFGNASAIYSAVKRRMEYCQTRVRR
jgi:hypothetical protein